MCACIEPVRTGIGAVCGEYGRPKWPITMLNQTDIPGTEKCLHFFIFGTLRMLVRPAMKRLFGLKEKIPSVASLPPPCLIMIYMALHVYSTPILHRNDSRAEKGGTLLTSKQDTHESGSGTKGTHEHIFRTWYQVGSKGQNKTYSYKSSWHRVYILGVSKAQKKTMKEARHRNVVVIVAVMLLLWLSSRYYVVGESVVGAGI